MYDDGPAFYVYGCTVPEQPDAIALQRYSDLAARARRHHVWWNWWMGPTGWNHGAGRIVRTAQNKLQALDEAEKILEGLLE